VELKFIVSHELCTSLAVDISAQEFVTLLDDQDEVCWSRAIVGDNLTTLLVNCGGFGIFALGYQRSVSDCTLFQVPATAEIRWTDSICCAVYPVRVEGCLTGGEPPSCRRHS
jgi:regulator of RNase E activity RraA